MTTEDDDADWKAQRDDDRDVQERVGRAQAIRAGDAGSREDSPRGFGAAGKGLAPLSFEDALTIVRAMVAELFRERSAAPTAFRILGEQGADRLKAALAVLAQPYYESEAAAAAAMFNSLINGHPFADGNKRFAVVATQVALLRNKILAAISGDEWEALALSTARGDIGVHELSLFFEDRLVGAAPPGQPLSLKSRVSDSIDPEDWLEIARAIEALGEVVRSWDTGFGT